MDFANWDLNKEFEDVYLTVQSSRNGHMHKLNICTENLDDIIQHELLDPSSM